MQRDEVLSILAQHQDSLKHFRIKSLAMFGSVARNEARPDSDIDILVEFEQPVTFDQYMELKFYLEDHLVMDRKEYLFDDGIRWVTATPNPPYKKSAIAYS